MLVGLAPPYAGLVGALREVLGQERDRHQDARRRRRRKRFALAPPTLGPTRAAVTGQLVALSRERHPPRVGRVGPEPHGLPHLVTQSQGLLGRLGL